MKKKKTEILREKIELKGSWVGEQTRNERSIKKENLLQGNVLPY